MEFTGGDNRIENEKKYLKLERHVRKDFLQHSLNPFVNVIPLATFHFLPPFPLLLLRPRFVLVAR